jgi:ribosomal protein S18 acetylase RimI-like enzyme
MMEVVFKEVKTEDIALVPPMVKEFYALEKIDFDESRVKTALAQFLSNPAFGRAWLIYADDRLAGYVIFTFGFCLEFGGRDAFIDEIYLKPEYRKQGIGKKAIDFLVESGKTQDIKMILLEVDHDNLGAQEVYKKKGFVPREKYFLMTKDL